MTTSTSISPSSSPVTTVIAVAICGLYLIVGSALIYLNQHILKSLDFPYPMFLSGMGVLASGLYAYTAVTLGFAPLNRVDAIGGWLWYKRVFPVGLASAGTLAFGNMVYLHLDVGFIQMLKSFTPVIIMLTGYFTKIESASIPVAISVLIISLGTATTCSFTPRLDVYGIFIMFLSQLAEAVRLVFTQFFLQQLKFGVTEGLYVLSPACAFWLFTASIVFEFPTMIEKDAFAILATYPSYFIAAAMMGVGLNFLSFFVIQYTSSLTLKILGTVRNIAMVVVGVSLYKEVITIQQAAGYAVALVGFSGYNLSKMGYFEEDTQVMIALRQMIQPCRKLLGAGKEADRVKHALLPKV